MKLHAPMQIKMAVYITNDETGQDGEAEISYDAFRFPTRTEQVKWLSDFAHDIENQAPGFRLMDKREAVNFMIQQKTGSRERVAIPGSENWDDIPDRETEIEELKQRIGELEGEIELMNEEKGGASI